MTIHINLWSLVIGLAIIVGTTIARTLLDAVLGVKTPIGWRWMVHDLASIATGLVIAKAPALLVAP